MSQKQPNSQLIRTSKLVAAAGIVFLLAGSALIHTTSLISGESRYMLGTLAVLFSAFTIYPQGDKSHTLFDGQRLRAYSLTIIGVTFIATAV